MLFASVRISFGLFYLLSCVVFALIGLTVFSLAALSSGPGCDYRSQKNCGLSVGVSRAEYCLNRNSCAALYPDVANRVRVCVSVCLRWMRGFVQGAGMVGPCG